MLLKEHILPREDAITKFTDQAFYLMKRPEVSRAGWLDTYRTSSDFAHVVETLHPCTLGIYILAKAREFTENHPTKKSCMESATAGFSTLLKAKAVNDAWKEIFAPEPLMLPTKEWKDFQDKLTLHGSLGEDDQAEEIGSLRALWDANSQEQVKSKPENSTLAGFIKLVIEKYQKAEATNIIATNAVDAINMGAPEKFINNLFEEKEDMFYYRKGYQKGFIDFQLLLNAIGPI